MNDIFVFIEEFEPKYVHFFIDKYLKDFKSEESYYECPKYGKNTEYETDSYDEMLSYVLNKKGRSFTFYMSNEKNLKYNQGIIQVNSDGSICLAISCNDNYKKEIYEELNKRFSNNNVYISNYIGLPLSKKDLNLELENNNCT